MSLISDSEIKRLSLDLKGGEPRCNKCRLDQHCETPMMKPTGKGEHSVLFITETPGAQEDEDGVQLIGKAGRKLRAVLKELGINLDDCRKINAVNCRPPDNETPTPEQIDACRPMVIKEINRFKPEIIITLGKTALESVIGNRYHEGLGALSIWRGREIPDRDLKTWVCPTFHPSYVNRVKDFPIVSNTFRCDLERALSDKPDIDWDETLEDKVNILIDEDDIKAILREFTRCGELTALDYETTGKKPFAKGQKIWSVALYNPTLGCYSFPYYGVNRNRLAKFLKSDTPKTAHNAKFEELWSRVKIKTRINKMVWCSMVGAHSLDNRRGTKSLKFLAFTNLGWRYWAGDTGRYLKSGRGGNGLNKIHKADLNDILLYGGIDTITQYQLTKQQMEVLGVHSGY